MAEEEDLAHEIADLERAQRARRVPVWDEVVDGRRDADEVVDELRAAGHDHAELERLAELMAPLDDAFEESLTDDLLHSLSAADAQPAQSDASTSNTEAEAPVDAAQADATVVVRSDRSWWQRGGAVAVAMAAAAAAAVIVLLPKDDPTPTNLAVTALPDHEMWLRPKVSAMRSADEGPVQVEPGAQLAVFLRPATRYAAKPVVWMCLEGPTPRPLEVTLSAADPGKTLEGTVTLPADLTPGPWTLLGVVDTRPAPADACAVQADAGRRLQRVNFTVVAP